MENYNIYKEKLEFGFSRMLDSNVLFWNLWNATYAFDTLERYKDEYINCFDAISEMWYFCWNIINNQQFNINEFEFVFKKNFPFEINNNGEIINPKGVLQELYENLSDDILPELCINQLIYRFNTIYAEISNREGKYGSNANETPIEIIALILASNDLGFVFNNMNTPIVRNEINAQIKLIEELSVLHQFTYNDRNIYRNKDDMDSIKYKE